MRTKCRNFFRRIGFIRNRRIVAIAGMPQTRGGARSRWTEETTPDRIRTCDLRFRKPPLYPLSYGGKLCELD